MQWYKSGKEGYKEKKAANDAFIGMVLRINGTDALKHHLGIIYNDGFV